MEIDPQPAFDPKVVPQTYKNQIDQRFEIMLQMSKLSEENKWSKVKEKKGVTIHKKEDKSGHNFIRGEGIIPGTIDEVLKIIYDDDKNLEELQILHEYDDSNSIAYIKSVSMGPVYSRDMLVYTQKRQYQNGCILAAMSIPDHQLAPPKKKGVIRAEIKFWGYIILPYVENLNHTSAIFVTQIDLKGILPKFISNLVTVEQSLIIHGIGILCKEGQQENQNEEQKEQEQQKN